MMQVSRAVRRDRVPLASRSPTARVAGSRSFQSARPRGGNLAVDQARVALGPRALDIPTRPLGVDWTDDRITAQLPLLTWSFQLQRHSAPDCCHVSIV